MCSPDVVAALHRLLPPRNQPLPHWQAERCRCLSREMLHTATCQVPRRHMRGLEERVQLLLARFRRVPDMDRLRVARIPPTQSLRAGSRLVPDTDRLRVARIPPTQSLRVGSRRVPDMDRLRVARTLPTQSLRAGSRRVPDMDRLRVARTLPTQFLRAGSRLVPDTDRLRAARTLPAQSLRAGSRRVPDTHKLRPVRTPLVRSRQVLAVRDLPARLEWLERTRRAQVASMGLARGPVLAIPAAQEALVVVNSRQAQRKTHFLNSALQWGKAT